MHFALERSLSWQLIQLFLRSGWNTEPSHPFSGSVPVGDTYRVGPTTEIDVTGYHIIISYRALPLSASSSLCLPPLPFSSLSLALNLGCGGKGGEKRLTCQTQGDHSKNVAMSRIRSQDSPGCKDQWICFRNYKIIKHVRDTFMYLLALQISNLILYTHYMYRLTTVLPLIVRPLYRKN